MTIDKDKAAELAMAMLSLTMFHDKSGTRAWKGLDWDVTDDLFERGWISDPKGKAKSVWLTEEGERMALECQRKHLLVDDEDERPEAG